MYVCKCGKEFSNKQSYCAHCSHCKENLRDRISKRSIIEYGEFICKCGKSFRTKNGLSVHKYYCKECVGEDRSVENKKRSMRYNTTEEILNNSIKVATIHLKNRLLNEGYKEWKCECCGLTEWNGKKIPLQLHHVDGDEYNNHLDNLQILCPNCHSLTDNYCRKKCRK